MPPLHQRMYSTKDNPHFRQECSCFELKSRLWDILSTLLGFWVSALLVGHCDLLQALPWWFLSNFLHVLPCRDIMNVRHIEITLWQSPSTFCKAHCDCFTHHTQPANRSTLSISNTHHWEGRSTKNVQLQISDLRAWTYVFFGPDLEWSRILPESKSTQDYQTAECSLKCLPMQANF